jgi:hypothetical protein
MDEDEYDTLDPGRTASGGQGAEKAAKPARAKRRNSSRELRKARFVFQESTTEIFRDTGNQR